jgi:hypothetical protein
LRRRELLQAKGLADACKILFGELAEQKMKEYVGSTE